MTRLCNISKYEQINQWYYSHNNPWWYAPPTLHVIPTRIIYIPTTYSFTRMFLSLVVAPLVFIKNVESSCKNAEIFHHNSTWRQLYLQLLKEFYMEAYGDNSFGYDDQHANMPSNMFHWIPNNIFWVLLQTR